MILNIPNVLTLFRIGLVPVFVLVFYLPYNGSSLLAAIIFSTAAITDWFDGYLARKLQQTSAFGAFLDPVADKIMVAVALVSLVDKNPTEFHSAFMSIAAMIIIGREITISALREWMAGIGARSSVAVSIIGKVKTTAQMGALVLLIYAEPIAGLPTTLIGFVFLYIAVVLTLWSMLDYMSAAWPKLKEK